MVCRGLTHACWVLGISKTASGIPVCWFTKVGLSHFWGPHGSSSAFITINKFHVIMQKKPHLRILRAKQYFVHILAHIALTLFMLRHSSEHGKNSYVSLQGSDAAVNSCHWSKTMILVSVYVVIAISYKITEFCGYLIHCKKCCRRLLTPWTLSLRSF